MEDLNDIPEALNRKAREAMKLRILQDVKMDLAVCQIEGWDHRAYIQELIDMLGGLISCG